jgi:hypothetical protein
MVAYCPILSVERWRGFPPDGLLISGSRTLSSASFYLPLWIRQVEVELQGFFRLVKKFDSVHSNLRNIRTLVELIDPI